MDFSTINFHKIKKYTKYIIRILSLIFAVICLICGMVPFLFYFHLNPGNIALILYATLILFVLLFDVENLKKEKYKKVFKIGKRAIVIFLTICFLIGLFISIFMIKYAFFNEPAINSEMQGTVVVLGCKINGDEPSKVLKGRLDKAYEYLNLNKDAVVIVSGGQNWDESVSESYVMKKYLEAKGIASERIYEEDKSTNTDENIMFSGEIIRKNNLPETMYIITDSFHSYRSYLFAEKNGYKAKNISADIYLPFLGEYWVRDILGVLHMKLAPNWELDIQNL